MTATEPVQPEVSIIVPARNEEANIGSCLESLVGQQEVEFEIIVVNDHSTDRTRPGFSMSPMRFPFSVRPSCRALIYHHGR
jgi:chlorobactene glucosyltransferase